MKQQFKQNKYQFKRNKQNFLICEICNKQCKNLRGLSQHIVVNHINDNYLYKNYYNDYVKIKDEELCVICKKTTAFKNFEIGYRDYCSNECLRIGKQNNCLKNHGVKYYVQSEEFKEKINNKFLKKYGVKYYVQSEEFKEKSKKTCLKRYGVEYPSQNTDIHNKQEKNKMYCKNYKNTNIHYRGTYELDFLKKYYNKFTDIKNGLTIRYKYKNKNRIYYPDFYIPLLNLIIEVKNSYLYKKFKNQIIAKEKATINRGFKYCIIIDKNYKNFDKLVTKISVMMK